MQASQSQTDAEAMTTKETLARLRGERGGYFLIRPIFSLMKQQQQQH